jgi:hypothetical protein
MKFVVARYPSLLVSLAALLLFFGAAALAAGGKWSFTHDPRGNPGLTYMENGKTVFFLGVGRAIGLWIAYPGPRLPDPPKSDKNKDDDIREETIEIHTATDVFVMKGNLTNIGDDNPDKFDSGRTYFYQWDLGVGRESTEFDNLGATWAKFIKSLAAAREIEIRTTAGNLVLPGITVKDISKQFGSVFGSTP